ncbi:MAG: MBL fold metallo-hydrolase [Clostridiales bacterium]|nr:MBL fold metallo-hydrolase [Clostridiales bacterium]
MIFCPLFSGSSGNALFVQYGSTRLLIDAGKSGRMLEEALNMVGVDPATLDAILITHEHVDHIAGAGVMCRKYHIPVYANDATWSAMAGKFGKVPDGMRHIFETGNDFYLGDFGIQPFAIPHDAASPVGYRLWGGNVSISTATDLGYFPREVRDAVAGSSLVLLESNHDPDLLRMNPHYSEKLKHRILGTRGHLSNDACAQALLQLVNTGVRNVILGHLSGENNTPELALETNERLMEQEGVRLGKDLHLEVALRDRVGSVYTLEQKPVAWDA